MFLLNKVMIGRHDWWVDWKLKTVSLLVSRRIFRYWCLDRLMCCSIHVYHLLMFRIKSGNSVVGQELVKSLYHVPKQRKVDDKKAKKNRKVLITKSGWQKCQLGHTKKDPVAEDKVRWQKNKSGDICSCFHQVTQGWISWHFHLTLWTCQLIFPRTHAHWQRNKDCFVTLARFKENMKGMRRESGSLHKLIAEDVYTIEEKTGRMHRKTP